MKTARLVLLALACSAPLLAAAQWQWLDKDGRKVFSDQAPPPDVPPNRILKQPGMRAAAAQAAAPGTAPAASAALPKVTGKDKALEDKRKQAEAAEAAKKKEHESKVAAVREDNCKRAKTAKASYDTGQRIAFTNEKGEKEYMTDERRAVEVRRLEEIIARDCRADRQ